MDSEEQAPSTTFLLLPAAGTRTHQQMVAGTPPRMHQAQDSQRHGQSRVTSDLRGRCDATSYRPAAAEPPPPPAAAHAHFSSTGDGQASVRLRPLTVSRPAVALYATWLAGSAAAAGAIVLGLPTCAACTRSAIYHSASM